MKAVSRFEANLLRILHAILGRTPVEQVTPLVEKPMPRPVCLRREAVELVQGALSKGTVSLLAREGWRVERFLRGGGVRAGRLWQRTAPAELALHFSGNTLEFLLRLTAAEPGDLSLNLPSDTLTVGDRLLLFLAYRALRGTGAGPALRQLRLIADHPLCVLAFPEDFAQAARESRSKPVQAAVARAGAVFDWSAWTSGVGSSILEALQRPLTRAWIGMERRKKKIKNPQHMLDFGRAQDRVLQSFCAACHAAQRWDLSRFLLTALSELLAGQPAAQEWLGELNVRTLRLAERIAVSQAALALLRTLQTLQGWAQQARTVGYFDEGYAASQLWKADWEGHDGDELCRRAEIVLRETQPL